MLSDAKARAQAIQPHHSYIVQAPAGSGKTELLTQRFLNLLTQVDAPEQVVALTFTRKAASEMKERILSTLKACQIQADSAHTLRPETLARAEAVLARDNAYQWHLIEQPHRLRVMTIDALCQSILRCMPLQSDFVAGAQVDTFPDRLYIEAAQACLAAALADKQLKPLLILLLRHLDNQQDKLIALWVSLLKARDQWLGVILQAKTKPRSHMEDTLKHLQDHLLDRLTQALPQTHQHALHEWCLQLIRLPHMPGWAECLKSWFAFNEINLEQAKALAKIVLTGQQTVRKRADHHIGLKKDACDAATYQRLKSESEALFEHIACCEPFVEALIQIIYLPHPEYDERQWEILQALLTLLLHLVAHLKLVFSERNRVDFIEIASCALMALGDEDAPTDLGLYFDYAIQHVLIDEFQDTSVGQFELIRRLTAGWQPGDGRTLFIVGDPMQSIYRFRQAEVGLFLKVKQAGLGSLQLTPLSLTSNFRSAASLVNWVNQHIAPIFPLEEDMELGAISFHASDAAREDLPAGQVLTLCAASPAEEAQQIVTLAQHVLVEHTNDTIAILVRSRSQLEAIIPALDAAGIAYQGVDLFSLSDMAYLRDIYALTQALLMPAARLPWLCVLRSPYVGLSLADLHAIAMLSASGSIYASLEVACASPLLSEAGRARLAYASRVFQTAFSLQDQFQLSEWVLKVHLQLIGQAFIAQDAWQDLERYFSLLDQFSTGQLITDWTLFESYFRKIYSTQVSAARLKIMTIHQSKGLEFDTVMLPGLGSITRRSDPSLLRWTSVIQAQGEKAWLISPLKAQEETADPLYDYLGRMDQEKDRYERQRLLYVAATRAKKRLYLLDHHLNAYAGSFRAMLSTVEFESSRTPSTQEMTAQTAWQPKQLYRLKLDAYVNQIQEQLVCGAEHPVLTIETPARRLGILTHLWLQRICQSQIKSLNALPWDMIEQDCEQAGWIGAEKEACLDTLRQQLSKLFHAPRGQWIIDAHQDAQNEYAFCVYQAGKTSTYIVDRMFYVDGCRWIIDFKTGLDDESAEQHHRVQVSRYAHHLKSYFNMPIYCGLYYLASNRWVEWVEDKVITA